MSKNLNFIQKAVLTAEKMVVGLVETAKSHFNTETKSALHTQQPRALAPLPRANTKTGAEIFEANKVNRSEEKSNTNSSLSLPEIHGKNKPKKNKMAPISPNEAAHIQNVQKNGAHILGAAPITTTTIPNPRNRSRVSV